MSSLSNEVFVPGAFGVNGVPHTASLQPGLHTLALTTNVLPCFQVDQSWPVESFAIVRASVLKLPIWTGKPTSSEYESVADE